MTYFVFFAIMQKNKSKGEVMSNKMIELCIGIVVNIIIIGTLFKVTDIFVAKLMQKYEASDNETQFSRFIPILGKIIKFLIAFVLIASFMQSQGYSLTSLVAGFGITGLAVGFAAQQTIASMFGTLGILSDKVYKTGDYVKIGDVEGVVENINLRSTKIRTLDNFLVTIPNDKTADSVVINISKAHKRRLDLIFGVTYDTSNEKIEKAKEIIRGVMAHRTDVYKDYSVFMNELDSSSINIRLIGYAKVKSFDAFVQIRSEIYTSVLKEFRANGIDFAFPSSTVYLAK